MLQLKLWREIERGGGEGVGERDLLLLVYFVLVAECTAAWFEKNVTWLDLQG